MPKVRSILYIILYFIIIKLTLYTILYIIFEHYSVLLIFSSHINQFLIIIYSLFSLKYTIFAKIFIPSYIFQ
jgi:hypothetical protein